MQNNGYLYHVIFSLKQKCKKWKCFVFMCIYVHKYIHKNFYFSRFCLRKKVTWSILWSNPIDEESLILATLIPFIPLVTCGNRFLLPFLAGLVDAQQLTITATCNTTRCVRRMRPISTRRVFADGAPVITYRKMFTKIVRVLHSSFTFSLVLVINNEK